METILIGRMARVYDPNLQAQRGVCPTMISAHVQNRGAKHMRNLGDGLQVTGSRRSYIEYTRPAILDTRAAVSIDKPLIAGVIFELVIVGFPIYEICSPKALG